MEDYDFYVLGSLDSPQGSSASEKLHGRFQGEEHAFDLFGVTSLLALESLRRAGRTVLPPEMLDTSINELASSQEGFARVIEALLRGKVCVDYLISTQGGDIAYWARTGGVFSLLQSNGGIVRTYALQNALSLGAVNWALGDERFACEHSRFMWHLPQIPEERSGGEVSAFDLEMTELTRTHMIEFFASIPGGARWAESIRQMQRQEQLEITAQELHEAGFVEHLFRYPQEVKTHISRTTPWQFTSDDNDAFLGSQTWYELGS